MIDSGKVKKLEKISNPKDHEKKRVTLKKNSVRLSKLYWRVWGFSHDCVFIEWVSVFGEILRLLLWVITFVLWTRWSWENKCDEREVFWGPVGG